MGINIGNCVTWKSDVGSVWGLTCIGQELFCRLIDSQTVNVYNTETGVLLRTLTMNCGGDYGALGTDGNDLYAIGDKKIYKVSKVDGATIATVVSLPDSVYNTQTFAIKDGKCFTGSYTAGFYIIDLATGTVLDSNTTYNTAICYLDDENWLYLTTKYAGAKFYSGTSSTPVITVGTVVGDASTINQNTGIGIDVKNQKIFTASYTDGVLNVYDISGLSMKPSSPSNLTATAGDSQVTLSWTAVTGATGYNVKRSTTAGGPYTTVGSNVSGTSYVDSAVANNTTYYYVVTALNGTNESSNSNEASATPTVGIVTPPSGNGEFLLEVTLLDGHMREYQLTQAELDAFVVWYTAKSGGTGLAYYTLNKFLNRKDYLVFDKIITFEVTDFNN